YAEPHLFFFFKQKTAYDVLPGGVEGLTEGFIGRRREQQQLIPALRKGDATVGLLHGVGGQGKSTLATRIANRLAADGFEVIAVKSVRANGQTAGDCARDAMRSLVTEFGAYADANQDKQ